MPKKLLGPKATQSTSKERIAVDTRRKSMMELRIAGYSLRAIAAELGCAMSTVTDGIERELAELTREPAERLRTVEVERMDEMLKALWPRIQSGDTASVDSGLRVMARRAKLLGLDAPVQVSADMRHGGGERPIKVEVTEAQALAELMQELRENPELLRKLTGE